MATASVALGTTVMGDLSEQGSEADVVLEWSCLSTSTVRAAVFPASLLSPSCPRVSVVWQQPRVRTLALPMAPENLSATVSGSVVTLKWREAASGEPASSHRLEVGRRSGASDVVQFDVDSAAATLIATNVPPGAYFIRVRGRSSSGFSSASNEIVVAVAGDSGCAQVPSPPTALAADVSGASVTLTWQSPPAPCLATAYTIEAGSAAGLSNLAAFSTGSAATTFSASGVGSGTYFVRVRASNAAGLSAPSNEVGFAVGPPRCVAPPPAPGALTGSVSGSRVSLTWTGYADATAYVIEAGSVAGAANVAVIDTGTAATTMQATAPDGTYYVRVRSKNLCGVSAPSNEITLAVGSGTSRATGDRPDDWNGYQVKILYAVSSDGVDQQLDTNGTIARTVESWERWFERSSGGQRVRLDTYRGTLDVAFLRLQNSDRFIASLGLSGVVAIQNEISAAGFNDPRKIYAIYYGGDGPHCGQAVWGGGRATAVAFLTGRPAGALPCPDQIIPNRPIKGFATAVDSPGYWEFVMAHEIVHTLGAVASCAPNAVVPHVGDVPSDLMYAGALRWNPSLLDYNHDDYFQHGRPCLDIQLSSLMSPSIPNPTPPPWALTSRLVQSSRDVNDSICTIAPHPTPVIKRRS